MLETDVLVEDRDNHQVIADGNVEARYEGRTMRADRVIYDTQKHTIRAQGHVQITDQDGSVRFAEEAEVDEQMNAGVATRFSMRLPGGGTAAAASALQRPDGVKMLNRAVYSACPICRNGKGGPTWTLKAREAKQNPNSKMMSYRNVVLQVRGAPVFYLPYFTHADPSSDRRSGLLTPDFGRDQRVGAFYTQPYYWAISPYQDLTVSPRFSEKVNPLVGLTYRKRFWSGDLIATGNITEERDFGSDGVKFGDNAWRSNLFASGDFRIDDYWRWGFDAARASDDLFLRRYSVNANNVARNTFGADLTRLFSQVDLRGQDANSYADLAFISVQGLRSGDDETVLPLVLPKGEYTVSLRDPLFDGRLKLEATTVNHVRNAGVNSARVSGDAKWSLQRAFGPGIVVEPYAEGRADYYRITDFPALGALESTFGRGLGLAGVEMRWPLLRAGENFNVIVEPIVSASYASDAISQNRVPNEDSLAFELDESNLFRPNAAPNYDLWEAGGKVAVGVRATALTNFGEGSAMFGRRWKSEADPAFRPTTNLNEKVSDYVGAVSVNLGQPLGLDLRMRLDDETLDLIRLDASFRAAFWRLSTGVRYFNVNQGLRGTDPSEEMTVGAALRLSRHWSLSYAVRRDLDSAINLSQDTGLTYQDDCTFMSLVYSRSETFDRVLGPSEGFQIKIGLTSLGVFGGSSQSIATYR
ncbi:MAG: LPS-assembly protein LptD [Hyphomonadaceae bacterium]